MQPFGRRHGLLGLALVVALAMFITACGSSSSSSSSSSTSSAASSAGSSTATPSSSGGTSLAALQAKIAQFTKAPTSIGPTVVITKPIPKGKSFVFENCGAPACLDMQESFDQAASHLGWHVTNITAMATPESIQAAYQQAVNDKPSAVIGSGISINEMPEQMKEFNALKIPVLQVTGQDYSSFNPSSGMTLDLQPPSQVGQATALMADKAVLDAGGKGEIGTVLLQGYTSVLNNVNAFLAEMKKVCPSCTTKQLSVPGAALGTTAPQLVTNFLRANPNIKGLYFGYAGMAVGLQAAAQGAGITLPKLYAWAPDAAGVQQLQQGVMTVAVPLCYQETGWQFADAAARLLTGGNIKDSYPWQRYVLWGKQYNNVPTQVNDPPCIPNYQAQFEKLWH
jgi:ABC-type sugar transport system substrate-binding protein